MLLLKVKINLLLMLNFMKNQEILKEGKGKIVKPSKTIRNASKFNKK